mmetsp:Transcript_47414/g.115469  ORF Transcript_47414/g.115469 Transcript_47414/m.115469 type:complete len:389 (-) Transcript_47414:1066-2232(-)
MRVPARLSRVTLVLTRSASIASAASAGPMPFSCRSRSVRQPLRRSCIGSPHTYLIDAHCWMAPWRRSPSWKERPLLRRSMLVSDVLPCTAVRMIDTASCPLIWLVERSSSTSREVPDSDLAMAIAPSAPMPFPGRHTHEMLRFVWSSPATTLAPDSPMLVLASLMLGSAKSERTTPPNRTRITLARTPHTNSHSMLACHTSTSFGIRTSSRVCSDTSFHGKSSTPERSLRTLASTLSSSIGVPLIRSITRVSDERTACSTAIECLSSASRFISTASVMPSLSLASSSYHRTSRCARWTSLLSHSDKISSSTPSRRSTDACRPRSPFSRLSISRRVSSRMCDTVDTCSCLRLPAISATVNVFGVTTVRGSTTASAPDTVSSRGSPRSSR